MAGTLSFQKDKYIIVTIRRVPIAQKNINFGTFPDDPNSDAIRNAFEKVQENFTDLYSGLQSQAVLSVNKTPGAGLTVNSPTGNVVMTANIACVQVRTSTLSIGRDANGAQYASITQSSQALWVDLPETISNVANANFSATVTANYVNANISFNTLGNVNTGNATVTSLLTVSANANVTGNLNVTANANVTANLNANNVSTSNLLTVGANANVTGNLNVTANANITANLKSGNANLGNLATANYFSGDGGLLTNVSAIVSPIISNGTSNVNIPAAAGNVNISRGGVANIVVVTGTGVNVAGTGNFTSNLSAANFVGTLASGNSNVTITANANVSVYVAGNATARMVATSTGVNVAGTLNATGNANVGNIGATNANITAMTATGNVTVGNLIGPHANGNSNVNIPAANGNVNISAVGNANVLVVTGTGANITGTLNATGNANVGNIGATNANVTAITATGNANVGNLGTAQVLATANITAPQLISNVATGTAPLVVTSTTQVANLNATTAGLATFATTANSVAGANVTGAVAFATTANAVAGANVSGAVAFATTANAVAGANVSGAVAFATTANAVAGANVSGTVSAATTAGTVTTAAQPNITSVGTLTSLGVTGNVTAGNLIGPHANGNSNVNIPAANGNVNISAVGNANVLVITGTGVNVSGTLNTGSGIITGNGSGLTSLTGANVTGQVGFAGVANSVAGANVSGAVAFATTANAVAGANVSGAVTYATTANAVAGANVSGQVANALVAGTVYTAAQPNITSVGTLSSLGVTGNITAGNLLGAHANGNSNVNIPAANGNVNISAAGNANIVVITGTGANITGTLNVTSNANVGNIGATQGVFTNVSGNGSALSSITGANVTGTVGSATTAGTVTTAAQPNITSVGTLSALTVTGNISSGNANLGNLAKANFFQGDGGLLSNITVTAGSAILNGTSNVTVDPSGNVRTSVAGTANVQVVTGTGVNVAGTLNATGNANVGNLGATVVAATLLGGTLTTAAQPNITSTGTLTGLTVSGVTNLGPIGNVTITGGSANYFLRTDGAGVLSWINATTLTTAPGSNTQVLFNDAGSFAANANLTFNKTTGNLSVGGGLTVTGNLAAANITGVTNLSATNITGTLTSGAQTGITAVGTLTALTVTGTAAANNLSATNYANVKYVNAINGALTTTSIPAFTGTQTWNNSAVTFTGILENITDTASAAGSLLLDLQVGGVSQANVTKTGNASFAGVIAGSGAGLTTLNASNISSGTLAQARLANSTFTLNGTTVTLGGTSTVTANTTQTLTLGSYLTGTSFNGGTAVTTTVDATTASTASKVVARDANANIYANNAIFTAVAGDGGNLSNIQGANVSGAVATATNATLAGNANLIQTNTSTSSTVYLAGVTTSANGYRAMNIVTGITANFAANSITATSFTGALANGTSNVSIPAAAGNVNVVSAGNTTLVVTGTGANITGTINASGNANVGNLGTATLIATTGNITTINSGLLQNGTSNVVVAAAGGNVTLGVAGTTRITATSTGANVTGTLGVSGNANVGNLGTAQVLATANITAPQLISNVATGTAPFVVTSTTQVANLSVDTAGSATTAGTVTTAAQPNITSVGTLTSLGVNGTLTAVNITANTGVFTGNANGLSSLQAGNLTGTVAQARLANSTLTLGNTTLTLGGTTTTVAGLTNITSTQLTSNVATGTAPLVVTSTTQVANLNVATAGTAGSATTAGTVTTNAQPNITSTGTLTSLTVSGNVTAQANVNMTGYVIRSVATGISAAGTTQGTATALSKEMNVVSTVASGAGVILPVAAAGMVISITNTSANALLVYPATSAAINTGATNAAYSQPAGATLQYLAPTTTQWYTVGATFA